MKEVELLNHRWVEFTIQVGLKTNLGSFGLTRKRYEFSFCAQSTDDARELVCRNVSSRGWPHDEIEVQIISCIPVNRDPFPLVHAPLKSCRELLSEEMEADAA